MKENAWFVGLQRRDVLCIVYFVFFIVFVIVQLLTFLYCSVY